jgi:hypothetical protein
VAQSIAIAWQQLILKYRPDLRDVLGVLGCQRRLLEEKAEAWSNGAVVVSAHGGAQDGAQAWRLLIEAVQQIVADGKAAPHERVAQSVALAWQELILAPGLRFVDLLDLFGASRRWLEERAEDCGDNGLRQMARELSQTLVAVRSTPEVSA